MREQNGDCDWIIDSMTFMALFNVLLAHAKYCSNWQTHLVYASVSLNDICTRRYRPWCTIKTIVSLSMSTISTCQFSLFHQVCRRRCLCQNNQRIHPLQPFERSHRWISNLVVVDSQHKIFERYYFFWGNAGTRCLFCAGLVTPLYAFWKFLAFEIPVLRNPPYKGRSVQMHSLCVF